MAEATPEERRQQALRACQNLMTNRGHRAPDPTSESESESDSEYEGPDGVLVEHAVSLKKLEKETKELNMLKKGDKQAIIEWIQGEGVTEKTLGPYLIRLKEKPSTGISTKQLRDMSFIPPDVLARILTAISSKTSTELKITKKRKAKKAKRQADGDAEEQPSQRQRTQ